MGKPDFILQLNGLSDAALAREIQLASHGSLGLVSDCGPRKAFAMRTQEASPLARSRAYLIGETGHAMPPIGAQGLNLSLRDAALAAELMAGAEDPGAPALCAKYDSQRRSDVTLRLAATGFMNRSLLSDLEPMHLARVAGLAAVGNVPWLRRFALEAGLKPPGTLPATML
jgi:2-octaprenyl-6-methoxyphenol hydroxylase